jgi:hypothetical protein
MEDAGDSGFANGLTAMQREVMDRRLQGEDVEIVNTRLPDGSRRMEIKQVGEVSEPKEVTADEAISMYGAEAPIEELRSLDEVLDTEKAEAAAAPAPVEEPAGAPGSAGDAWVCEMCGHKRGDPVYVPTAADKQFFVETVFGDTPFEKAFEFLGGNLVVRCVAPDREALDVGFRLLQWAFEKDRLRLAVEEKEYYTRIHAAMMVDSMTLGGKAVSFERIRPPRSWSKMAMGEYAEMFDAVLARIGEFGNRYPFVAMATAQFLGVYNELVVHALDENFWTGVSRA